MPQKYIKSMAVALFFIATSLSSIVIGYHLGSENESIYQNVYQDFLYSNLILRSISNTKTEELQSDLSICKANLKDNNSWIENHYPTPKNMKKFKLTP